MKLKNIINDNKTEIYTQSKSSLVLMEIIISVFILAFTSAICISFFVAGYLTDRDNKALVHALEEVGNSSEIILAYEGDMEKLAMLTESMITDNKLVLYYSKEFERCDSSEAKYKLEIIKSDDLVSVFSLNYVDVYNNSEEKIIYSVNLKVSDT